VEKIKVASAPRLVVTIDSNRSKFLQTDVCPRYLIS